MVNKYLIKKEDQEIKKIDDLNVDEIILQAEKDAEEQKLRSFGGVNSGESTGKIRDKTILVLVFVLLVAAIIQSIELFNLRAQIAKGQFSTGASAPAGGASQELPSQQGGC